MDSAQHAWIALAAGMALALLCLPGLFFCWKRKRLLEDTPTSKVQGVFVGLVEVTGTAESERPLRSFLAGDECVCFSWTVEEHWSKTVTETYRDSKGRTGTRTRHESGWTTVASGGEMQPFYLRDETGVLRVIPDGAKLEPVKVFDQTCGPADALYYGHGPAGAVAHSDQRRRFVERAIPLHHSLYILGHARERADAIAPEIAAAPDAPAFLISTRSEKEVTAGYGWGRWFWLAGGLATIVGGWVVQGHLTPGAPGAHPLLLAAALAVYALALVLGWVWLVFNSLVALRQRVRQAWTLVDIQLKRRNDLIPRLMATVEGYRSHEQTVQETVARLRTQLDATPPGTPGPDHAACAGWLRAAVEAYPELRASEAFLRLQSQLVETEERIALARSYFNDIVTFHNTRIALVPDQAIAALAGLQPQALIAAEFERGPVTVSLAPAAPTSGKSA